jgi:hypothetical protein
MSLRTDSERERRKRAKDRDVSHRVAVFLSDFNDDLVTEEMDARAVREILVAVAPVVMNLAMKGIFK